MAVPSTMTTNNRRSIRADPSRRRDGRCSSCGGERPEVAVENAAIRSARPAARGWHNQLANQPVDRRLIGEALPGMARLPGGHRSPTGPLTTEEAAEAEEVRQESLAKAERTRHEPEDAVQVRLRLRVTRRSSLRYALPVGGTGGPDNPRPTEAGRAGRAPDSR
jgi:hypothetical protein